MANKGLVHIYCGNGKGKTTAAVGLAVRCVGGGGRVLFYQFLKNDESGELNVLDKLENIEVFKGYKTNKFSFQMTDAEKAQANKGYSLDLKLIKDKINENQYDLLVLDEAVYAINLGFISIEEIMDLIQSRPYCLEVVLTGRDPDKRLCEEADYISETEKIKHPFDKGVQARRLIER